LRQISRPDLPHESVNSGSVAGLFCIGMASRRLIAPVAFEFVHFDWTPKDDDIIGGQGSLLRRIHFPTNVMYAVKVISFDSHAAAETQATNEAALLSSLTYPFIANALGSFVHGRSLYIVMKAHRGHVSFNNISTDHEGRAGATLSILTELTFAVEYLHAKKIAHVDIKPENVLYNYSRHFALTDFGISIKVASPAATATSDHVGGYPDVVPTGEKWGGGVCGDAAMSTPKPLSPPLPLRFSHQIV
jgi:serine/threonine protein kinase